jgi:Uma2 family endonuclease
MATHIHPPALQEIDYPTGDDRPMAETEVHRENMTGTIDMLRRHFKPVPDVYVSGNMFVYYVEGNRHKHVAPDVFVVFGVPRRQRECYKLWAEPKHNLDFVVEYTSRSTKGEDVDDKYHLYRDWLGVREYALFDPYEEYLDPPLQLHRLVDGEFVPVEPVDGRLPSEVLGLHLERDGQRLRFYDPKTGEWVLTSEEGEQRAEARRREEEARRREEEARRKQAEQERDEAAARLRAVEAELERMRRERESRDGGES